LRNIFWGSRGGDDSPTINFNSSPGDDDDDNGDDDDDSPTSSPGGDDDSGDDDDGDNTGKKGDDDDDDDGVSPCLQFVHVAHELCLTKNTYILCLLLYLVMIGTRRYFEQTTHIIVQQTIPVAKYISNLVTSYLLCLPSST